MRVVSVYLLGLVMLFSTVGVAQKSFEGVIHFGMEYVEVPDEMEGYESMLPQEMKIHISDPYLAVEQQVMGADQIVVTNTKKMEGFMLMEMMGKKMAITMSKEDLEDADKDQPESTIEYVDETKEIAGYTCHKAVVTTDGEEVVVWYTEDIKQKKSSTGGIGGFGLAGMPLEYETNANGIRTLITATKVEKKKLDDVIFEIPEGYEVMTLQEMQGQFGQ